MAKRSPREIADDLKRLVKNSQANRDRVALLQEVQTYQEELTAQNEALVHAQQQLEQTRDHFIGLFDFAPNGYIVMDDNGVIRRVNLTAASLLRTPRDSIEGLPLLRLVEAADRPEMLAFLRRCRSHQHDSPAITTEISVRSGNATLPVQLICKPSLNATVAPT